MSTTTVPTKPVTLYTYRTPNGYKVSIFLEELKAAYPSFDYDWKRVDIRANEQKEPWFLAINPNGRIPALTDHTRDNFNVFESAAILLYLHQHFDKDKKFGFDAEKEPEAWSELQQWIFFAHGGIGPMQGQSNWFRIYAPEKIEYAITRYTNEAKRLYSVLDARLKDREYLAGPGKGKYTIADINLWPWVNIASYAGIESYDEWPNLKAWLERIRARPTLEAGHAVPPP